MPKNKNVARGSAGAGRTELIGLGFEYVGKNIFDNFFLSTDLMLELGAETVPSLSPPARDRRLRTPSLSARVAAPADYPPGTIGRIGQKGFRLVIFQHTFDGSPAGHLQHSGGFTDGFPAEWRAGDGDYLTVTIGPACGVVNETLTIYTYDGKTGTGHSSARVIVAKLEDIGTSPDFVLIGSTSIHSDNHRGAPDVNRALRQIAGEYRAATGQPLYFNDMSLPWGGLFDISGQWQPPHQEHRNGRVIDIAATAQTLKDEAKFVQILNKYTKNYIVEGSGSSRHYHVRF